MMVTFSLPLEILRRDVFDPTGIPKSGFFYDRYDWLLICDSRTKVGTRYLIRTSFVHP
jgi:hypothetical protein